MCSNFIDVKRIIAIPLYANHASPIHQESLSDKEALGFFDALF